MKKFLKKIGKFFGIFENGERRGFTFAVRWNFLVCLIALFASLIFTQALRSTLSVIVFVFFLVLPFAMLIYVLLAKAAIKVRKISSSETVEKLDPYTYEYKISNRGLLVYPFVDAVIDLPDKNFVRTALRKVRVFMPPFGKYLIKNTVRFRFRGTYTVGIKYFYVYDVFRLFRLRIDVDATDTVCVVPRRLHIDDENTNASSEEAEHNMRSSFSYERVEISDVRDYRTGDSLKSIHWKLSSKSDDLVVRDYDSGSAKQTYVFSDMSAPYSDLADELALPEYCDDINECCADAVSELTVAAVIREIREGSTCSLFWFDGRTESGFCGYTLRGIDDFDKIFLPFATAPVCDPDYSLFKLSSEVRAEEGVKYIFVTSAIDRKAVSEYARIADALSDVPSVSAQMIFYDPTERFKASGEREIYIKSFGAALASHGMSVTDGRKFLNKL